MSFHSSKEPEDALNKLNAIIRETKPNMIHESVSAKPDGRGGYKVIAESSGRYNEVSSVEIRVKSDIDGSIIEVHDHRPATWGAKAPEIESKIEEEWFKRR